MSLRRLIDLVCWLGDEMPSASEEDLQLGEISFSRFEVAEAGPHTNSISDDVGIGLGLPTVGVARVVHHNTGKVDDSLLSLPQECQKQSGPASGLVDSLDDFLGKAESFANGHTEAYLVIVDLAVGKLCPRIVEQMSPLELLTGIDFQPRSAHDNLRSSVISDSSTVEDSADSSLRSESLTSPISISSQSLQGAQGTILLKPSNGDMTGILGPLGVIQELHPDNTQKGRER